jgi:hypothetical protein
MRSVMAWHRVLELPQCVGQARAHHARTTGSTLCTDVPGIGFRAVVTDGAAAAAFMVPDADPLVLIKAQTPPLPMRERMLTSPRSPWRRSRSGRCRTELQAAGDIAGGCAFLMRFQELTSLVWRCFTRARRLAPDQEIVCYAAVDSCGRPHPPLPAEYFGNCVSTIRMEVVLASLLLGAGTQARVAGGGAGGGGAHRREHTGSSGAVDRDSGAVHSGVVLHERRAYGEIAAVQHVRLRLRVGEGASGFAAAWPTRWTGWTGRRRCIPGGTAASMCRC